MGKEEAFFSPAASSAAAQVISATSREETVPKFPPAAWACWRDLVFCPFTPSGVTTSCTGVIGRGGGTGTGIPHCLQLCRQMCPLLVAPQLRHLGAATSAPPTQILLRCPKDTKDYTKYVTNLHVFSAGRITVSTT